MKHAPVAAVIGLSLLGGCAAPRPPSFSVADVHPTERTDQGVAVLFTLDAKNDNDVALPLRDVQYTVELGGQKVFTGTRSAEATLRRLGTQQISLPAVVNTGAAGAPRLNGRIPFRLTGTATYITPGQIAEILFDTGVHVPTVSFAASGEVEMDQPVVPAAPAVPPTAPTAPTPAAPPAAAPGPGK